MQLGLDQLPGRSVLDNAGHVLGQIEGFVVDTESWAIAALRVRLKKSAAGHLGLGWSPFRPSTLDVPTGLVMAASDAVILRAALDDLQSLARESQMGNVQPGLI
jgi:sporulation protein YlmC with PRC-barrel domain